MAFMVSRLDASGYAIRDLSAECEAAERDARARLRGDIIATAGRLGVVLSPNGCGWTGTIADITAVLSALGRDAKQACEVNFHTSRCSDLGIR